LLTDCKAIVCEPAFTEWEKMLYHEEGAILGKTQHEWKTESRIELGVSTDKPIIVVGHQPTFFHPGILAKFIAADRLASEVNGEVIFLVVDHHKGLDGTIETPNGDVECTSLQSDVPMRLQPRVDIVRSYPPFTTVLQEAIGENSAIQYANAISSLLSSFAHIHRIVMASDLVQTTFGKSIIKAMRSSNGESQNAYNTAVKSFPDCHIRTLEATEVPIWEEQGVIFPKALLLTLLSRLVLSDLFVHGFGGMQYDKAMEQWCKTWLQCIPSNSVMMSATMRLPIEYQSVTEARRAYNSPPHAKNVKANFLKNIEHAPPRSAERKIQFQMMRRWLNEVQPPFDMQNVKQREKLAQKRDWAFPLFEERQLTELREAIHSL